MTPAAGLSVAVALALTGADGTPPAKPPEPPTAEAFAALGEDAAVDLIVLGETAPIFVRLRVMVGAAPFRAAWLDATRAFHATLDRNLDGKVTPEEAEAALPPAPAPNPNAAATTTVPARARPEVDSSPKDGAVSVEELIEALKPLAGPFRLQTDGTVGRRTDALFDHLDRDQDGQLTRPELAALVGSLRLLDRDDNELIGAGEVAPAETLAVAPAMAGRAGRDPGVPPALVRVPGESPLRVVRTLMRKYDTGSSRGPGRPDARLSPEEFTPPAAAFAAADRNADGFLNAEDLRAYLAAAPLDALLDVALPAEPTGRATVRVRGADGGAPKGVTVRQLAEGVAELDLGPVRLDVHADDGATAAEAARRTLRAQFDAADVNQDGYVEQSEAASTDNGQASPLAGPFRALDRNSDGKLFPQELDDYVAQQAAAARARLTLTASDEGRALFGLLDLDRDRQLGAREVLDTFARVSACDRDSDGRVAPEEIPHHIQLTLSRGDLAPTLGLTDLTPGAPPTASSRTRTAGPAWFRRSDRNRDGDVSRREFLGTREQFDRLDRDRDGLLAPDEADAARPAAPPRQP